MMNALGVDSCEAPCRRCGRPMFALGQAGQRLTAARLICEACLLTRDAPVKPASYPCLGCGRPINGRSRLRCNDCEDKIVLSRRLKCQENRNARRREKSQKRATPRGSKRARPINKHEDET